VIALAVVMATQQSAVAIGHSYSSIGALRQPATVMALRSNGGPWLTKLDAGLLATLPTGAGFDLQFGVRASVGSARTRAERVISAVARTDWSFTGPNLGLGIGVEFETDDFNINKMMAGAELTPLAWGAVGLGRFTHHRMEGGVLRPYGLRWRPWIGAAAGERFRGHARLEAALRVPLGGMAIEGAAEGTSWYSDGGFNGINYLDASLSLETGHGWSLTITAEEGRRPPGFGRASRVAVGIGLRLPPPSN